MDLHGELNAPLSITIADDRPQNYLFPWRHKRAYSTAWRGVSRAALRVFRPGRELPAMARP
jgi:hypothetical protein